MKNPRAKAHEIGRAMIAEARKANGGSVTRKQKRKLMSKATRPLRVARWARLMDLKLVIWMNAHILPEVITEEKAILEYDIKRTEKAKEETWAKLSAIEDKESPAYKALWDEWKRLDELLPKLKATVIA